MTNFDIWEHCTFAIKYMGPLHGEQIGYVGTLHERSIFKGSCGKNGDSVWITVEKIKGYMGTLHGNLWVCCTELYGFVARNKS
ncbi:hypothetical protein C5469_21800 [Photorhabdus cinerea]|uniref:Uncharacterized protein n=1 Tax=Photorhabdus cinerea TaxID=471575 RepID=A0A7X5TK60_9GAMM|nr:hypothetical protein [Photorhabdus cinerea]